MVQLKSFKSIQVDESDNQQHEQEMIQTTSGQRQAADKADAECAKTTDIEPSASSSSSASSSTIVDCGGGGNLTRSNTNSSSASDKNSMQILTQVEPPSQETLRDETSSERATTINSNEEYQSAQVDLNSEEGDSKTTQVGGEHNYSLDTNVTRINIEHKAAHELLSGKRAPHIATQNVITKQKSSPQIVVAANNSGVKQQQAMPSAAATTQVTTPNLRQKLYMQRSQTSPSHLNQMPLGKSPQITRRFGGASGAIFSTTSSSSPKIQKRNITFTGDNMSQHSFGTMQQKVSNHFEIRWQNVRLVAQPKSWLPDKIVNNRLYKILLNNKSNKTSWTDNNGDVDVAAISPRVQHKIPPTIDEHLELNAAPSSSSSSSSSSMTPPPSKSSSLASNLYQNNTQEQQKRCILNSISGQVFSGQITAILGPSGVGKTTLLNSLTGRNTLEGTGRVSLIGALNSKRMSVVTVPQADVLPGKLTTLEDLQFTSRLKNPQAQFNHTRNIERIVKCLHMDKFLHTRIDKLSGGEARRLSIARELLASPDIMILDEPTSGLDANTCKKIITALRDIVEHSDNILDKPMSIIITIHQPQQEVYNLFHRVYVMAQGGRVIYEGQPRLLLPTLLEQSSLAQVCKPNQLNTNPAIVAIEVASGEFGPQVIDELASYHEGQVCEEFSVGNAAFAPFAGTAFDSPLATPRSLRPHKSPMSVSRSFDMRKRLNSIDSSVGRPTPVLTKRNQQQQQQLQPPAFDRISSVTSLSYASTYDEYLPEQTSKLKVDKRLRRSVVMKSHFFSHTLTLMHRCWKLTTRDKFLMMIRILGFLLVAGGTVQIFSHALDPEEHQCPAYESEVDDMYSYVSNIKTRLVSLLTILRQGNATHLFFFHLLLCITMVTSALTGLVFPLQMRMFVREYKNGWYSPASFIMSQTIAELPIDMIGPLVTLLITYPLCHQPDSMYYWRECAYAIVLIVCSIICKSQAQIVGAFLMDSVENSVFISCVCVTAPALLSGIPLRIDQMIMPMQIISYGSFLRYAFESLLSLRYGYGMCPCDPELVNGYPLSASSRAIPPHLENLAIGFIEINQPTTISNNFTSTLATTQKTLSAGNPDITTLATPVIGNQENLFLKFLRLLTDASNQFVQGSEIGDCSTYRSLYLVSNNIPGDVFEKWLAAMCLMFVISRFLTYFVVKTVIKIRRS